MLLFCPNCSNMLTVARAPHSDDPDEDARAGQNRFECRSCPYAYLLPRPLFERKKFKPKEADDIVGSEDAMKNANKVGGLQCPNEKCDSTEAYHQQAQIRSADEPMTNRYTCISCKTVWRD